MVATLPWGQPIFGFFCDRSHFHHIVHVVKLPLHARGAMNQAGCAGRDSLSGGGGVRTYSDLDGGRWMRAGREAGEAQG
jgi:hypothetical protein